MKHEMFVVKHEGRCYGPFLELEARIFASTQDGAVEVLPLVVPTLPDEKDGSLQVQLLTTDAYRSHVDSFKVDTSHMLGGIIQQLYFARRDGRVLTAREILELWKMLFRVSRAIESLMHYAEKTIAEPTVESLEQLRKAFWRNRDADDVDAHYADRFW